MRNLPKYKRGLLSMAVLVETNDFLNKKDSLKNVHIIKVDFCKEL